MRSDGELLDAWRAGDAGAGDELFERHFDALYRFFASRLSTGVEDAIQQTLLGCVEARDRFRGEASFRSFLFAIARNQLLAAFRARRRGGELDPSVTSLCDLGPSPPSALSDRREHKLLIDALRSMPLDLQIAVELHYWEGMSGPEIAAVLDLPEGTVRSRLRRAIEGVKERVAELSGSAELTASTLTGFDTWAESLKSRIVGPRRGGCVTNRGDDP
jgi:RNA polymerase sigma-70 factor (ECF subfamily)